MTDPTPASWVDRHGDVWTLQPDGLLHTLETRPFPREHVEKKWGPLRPTTTLPTPTEPAQHHLNVKVDELSINFDDYCPEAKARHEDTSLFVGVHVPREFAKHLTLATTVTITITEKQPTEATR